MQTTQVFVLTVAEVLDACEEYIKAASGTVGANVGRNHCHFIGLGDAKDLKNPMVEMGFKS